jgi:hypothetical protein
MAKRKPQLSEEKNLSSDNTQPSIYMETAFIVSLLRNIMGVQYAEMPPM